MLQNTDSAVSLCYNFRAQLLSGSKITYWLCLGLTGTATKGFFRQRQQPCPPSLLLAEQIRSENQKTNQYHQNCL